MPPLSGSSSQGGLVPIPEFVVELRRPVGDAVLWLPAVTAVIRRGASTRQKLSDGSTRAVVTG